jgi:hypothetical protein
LSSIKGEEHVGRHSKIVFDSDDLDRREVGYYATPSFVTEFFAKRILELRPHAKRVLDPCIGKGEFTAPLKARGCHITGYDVVDMRPSGCDVFNNRDFLKFVMDNDRSSLFVEHSSPDIDVIVANPPYNCHEVDYIRNKKTHLIARFGKSAALNMYALFIRAILDYAPDGCIIGLVTHDSFLTANGHQELRRYILEQCNTINLHLCPTNLFADQGADVRTCLMILEKSRSGTKSVKVSNRPASVSEFKATLLNNNFEEYSLDRLLLGDMRDNAEFTIGVPSEIAALFREKRISEIAPCVTGISTGDDKKYLRQDKSAEFSVPFYKNPATRNFFAGPDGYLCSNYDEVGRLIPNFMIRNKDLIFRGGISCSSMGVRFGAALRPKGTACGVNPNIIIEDERQWWLLSFLNSRLCLYLTRAVIIRGNMITAGYASRIPIPSFDALTADKLSELGMAGFRAAQNGHSIKETKLAIDDTIEQFVGLSNDTRRLLQNFERDPTRLA